MAIKTNKSSGPTQKTATLITTKAKSASQARKLTPQQIEQFIRDRAYYLYLERGCSHSVCANQDWYEAERQIKRELRLN